MQYTVDVGHGDRRKQSASVVEAFERQVDADPQREAIRRPGRTAAESVSFGMLEMWANAIAAELIVRYGSGSDPVALLVRPPELMLAAALGALKAGKFYAAVNPLHPARHVRRILEELDAPLLLCDRASAAAVPPGLHALSVEDVLDRRPAERRPGLEIDERRLAYVLYTSGSTGRPRGVAQSRRDMLHNVARHRPLAIGAEDCVTLISADGFVSSISNPYIALLGGAALAPYSFRDAGVELMMEWLDAAAVTVLYGFPSFLRQLASAVPSRAYGGLRLAYLGGETVLPTDLKAARRLFPAATLNTGLNSSETGLTCLHVIPPGSPVPEPVPVGRPVLDVEVAIVDESGRLAASGACGEIEVRSAYVRPRYWSRGGVDGDTPALAFRTGDRGRIGADGLVYHLGRVDQMVKVRGFRVETTEVEAAISALPQVAEAAVFATGQPPEAVLAACVVGRGATLDAVAVRRAVADELPAASIPARILVVDALPRTPNGKLDRARLTEMAGARGAGADGNGALAGPDAVHVRQPSIASAIERRIAEIWCSELELDHVGEDVDFFALGGTSLTAVAVISRVRGELGVAVPLAALFRAPTLRALASAVADLQAGSPIDERRGSIGPVVRPARKRDFAEVCALVNHYIEHTTFDPRREPRTSEEWIEEWAGTRSRYPWVTACVDGVVAGVAYAGRWKDPAAYDGCAEVRAYVAPGMRGAGVGRALYGRLLAMLDSGGYRTQVAAVALPNPAGVAFHEALGFRHAGTLAGVGHKHGTLLDVGFWQRGGGRRGRPPTPSAPVAVE